MGRRHPDAQLQDEERRRKQQLEEIRKREADERNKQEEEQRWREEERAKWEAAEKVKPHCLFFVVFFLFWFISRWIYGSQPGKSAYGLIYLYSFELLL